MPDLPPNQKPSSPTAGNTGRAAPPGTPRWVKVFAVVFMLLVLAVVALHLAGVNFAGHMPHMP